MRASRASRAARAASVALAAGVASFGLTPAQAQAATVWDRLAQCESSGNWRINTGNGYYGGLQFSASTWRGFGGGAFASRADLATKAEQIYVATKVQKVQGWNAWPACSRKLGLRAAPPAAAKPSANRTTSVSRSAARVAPGARYVVRSGDSLSKIAARQHVRGGWKHLYALNRAKVGANPNHLRIGQVLRLR